MILFYLNLKRSKLTRKNEYRPRNHHLNHSIGVRYLVRLHGSYIGKKVTNCNDINELVHSNLNPMWCVVRGVVWRAKCVFSV